MLRICQHFLSKSPCFGELEPSSCDFPCQTVCLDVGSCHVPVMMQKLKTTAPPRPNWESIQLCHSPITKPLRFGGGEVALFGLLFFFFPPEELNSTGYLIQRTNKMRWVFGNKSAANRSQYSSSPCRKSSQTHSRCPFCCCWSDFQNEDGASCPNCHARTHLGRLV